MAQRVKVVFVMQEEGKSVALTLGEEYLVVGVSDASFRVVNERLEPILYPRACFVVVDERIPEDWVRRDYEGGEYHISPPEVAEPGFYEDYFDGRTTAIKTFEEVLSRLAEFRRA